MQTIQKRSERNMNNKLEVIGIDHGWSMMKTISQVFITGIKEITTTPACQNCNRHDIMIEVKNLILYIKYRRWKNGRYV